MLYSSEREMVPDIICSLPNLFKVRNNYAHAQEVTEGSRIIDIVFARFHKSNKSFKNLIKYAKLFNRIQISQLQILAIIWKYKKITLSRISSLTYTNSDIMLRDFIKPLEDLELIQCAKRKTYMPKDWAGSDLGYIYTIEAKLNNWKSAFCQAIDNKKRSDFSYVAFPQGRLTNRDYILAEAESKGIGIIEVSPHNGSKILIEGKRAQSSRNLEKYVFILKIASELVRTGYKWTLKVSLAND